VTLALLAGVLVGAGLWWAWSGWTPAREPLAVVLSRLGRPPVDITTRSENSRDARVGAVVRKIDIVDRYVSSVVSDLRILHRSPDEQAGQLVVAVAVGFLWVPVVSAGAALFGFYLAPALIGAGALAGAVIGGLAVVQDVASKATARRREFSGALGAFCDVAGMSLASGNGIETAAQTSANAGSGWAFAELRSALESAHRRGQTPWDALAQLGHETGHDDLIGLSSLLVQAGVEGASVRETIRNKARTMREREAANAEAGAASTTERMSMPAALLLIGFLFFLAFPALAVLSTV
jgi:Flp pilus assembly protein TadB